LSFAKADNRILSRSFFFVKSVINASPLSIRKG
jgi:hypothetical protein